MKKVLLVITIGIILLSFTSCKSANGAVSRSDSTYSSVADSSADGIGGSERQNTDSMYSLDISYVPRCFYGDYVKDDDGYIKWLNEKRAEKPKVANIKSASENLTAVTEVTIVDYILDFNIPRSEFEKMNIVNDNFRRYTDEQIDVIYTLDPVSINREFAFPSAYVSADGKTIYPARWFIEKPISEWKAAGISKDDIKAMKDKWQYVFGDEGLEYYGLNEKIENFVK